MNKTVNKSASIGAVPVLFGAQLAIASSAIFAKFALVGAGAVMVAAWRLTIAVVIVGTIAYRNKQLIKVPASHERLLAFCGFALAFYWSAWIQALDLTSVATATLLVSTTPIWTTLYDVLILRRRPPLQFWCGSALTIIGAVIAVWFSAGGQSNHSLSQQLLGAALSVTGGLAFAAYLVSIRAINNLYSTTLITSRTYAWAACALWIWAAVTHEHLPATTASCWGGIVGSALIPQVLGYAGLNASLKIFSPNVVAISTLLEPVFAGILALFIFGESLSGATICGAVLIVAGLVAVLMAETQSAPTEPLPQKELIDNRIKKGIPEKVH